MTDTTANSPWLTEPEYRDLEPTFARSCWEADRAARPARKRLQVVEPATPLPPEDRAPPVDSMEAFGLPADETTKEIVPVVARAIPRPRQFPLEWLDDVVASQEPTDLIEGILPMGPALGVIFGPPKSFKSFLAELMGVCVAAGLPFGDRRVQSGAVVTVTSEGIRGVRRRLVATRRALGIEGQRVPFALVPVMPDLGSGPNDRLALQEAISRAIEPLGVPLRMINLDTLRRALPGKSENKPEDMSVLVNNCDHLAKFFGCLVQLLHHSPRSNEDRGSGSNVLDAAADVMIGVKREEGARTATAIVKTSKDGEEGTTWNLELRTMDIGTDRNGKAITGAHVELTSHPSMATASASKVRKLSPAQQRLYDILLDAVAAEGVTGLAGDAAPPTMPAIKKETLKVYCKKNGWWDSSDAKSDHSARSRFGARLNELAGKHVIGLTEEHVWSAMRAT